MKCCKRIAISALIAFIATISLASAVKFACSSAMRLWNSLRRSAILLLGLILAVFPVEGQESPSAFSTRTFYVPNDFLSGEFLNNGGLVSDPLCCQPPSGSAKEAWQKLGLLFTAKQLLSQRSIGLTFPPGTWAMFDPAASALTVKNDSKALELLAARLGAVSQYQSRNLAVTMHLVQATDSLLKLLSANAAERQDQTEDLGRLLSEAAKGGPSVRVIHTSMLKFQSGMRTTLHIGSDYEYTSNLAVDGKGGTTVDSDARPLGWLLEMDSHLDLDSSLIHFNLSAEQTLLLPDAHRELLTEPISGAPLERPQPRFKTAKLETALDIRNAQTRLISIWPAFTESGEAVNGMSTGLFITPHLVPRQEYSGYASLDLPADPEAVIERSFALPSAFLTLTSTDPADVGELLQLRGIDLPTGSKATWDPSEGLVVVAPAEFMPLIQILGEQARRHFPTTVEMDVHIYRAPAVVLRPLLHKWASLQEHSASLLRMEELVAEGRVSRTLFSHLESSSAKNPVLKSNLERQQITELNWQSGSKPVHSTERRSVGTSFHIDPYIENDGSTITFKLGMERHFSTPRHWQETLSNPAAKEHFLMPRHEWSRAHLQTMLVMSDGTTDIFGLWRPVDHGGKIGADELEIGFVTSRIARHIPVPPFPTKKSVLSISNSVRTPGSELLTRSFRVPPSFTLPEDSLTSTLAPNGSSKNPDPFASGPSASSKKDPYLDRLTIYLKSKGISFPDGAGFPPYGAVTQQVIMTNTLENLGKFEALLQQFASRETKELQFALHLIEAPSRAIVEAVAETAGKADHTPALRTLTTQAGKDEVRALASLQLASRHGQMARTSQAQEQVSVEGTSIDKDGVFKIDRATTLVGAALELQNSLREDGLTIDLTCSLTHHPAPPIPHTENLAPAGSPPIEVPLTDFHVESYQGTLTMLSGTARILAIWKPTGRPEFTEKDLLHIAILEARAIQVSD